MCARVPPPVQRPAPSGGLRSRPQVLRPSVELAGVDTEEHAAIVAGLAETMLDGEGLAADAYRDIALPFLAARLVLGIEQVIAIFQLARPQERAFAVIEFVPALRNDIDRPALFRH